MSPAVSRFDVQQLIPVLCSRRHEENGKLFLLSRLKRGERGEKKSVGITQWVKEIIRINEVKLLLESVSIP